MIEASPNTVGADGGILATPGAAPAVGTAPNAVPSVAGQQSVPLNTLPPGVRSALQGFSGSGALGTVAPVPGRAGLFRATVTQNGVPMEMVLAPSGQVISQTPITGSQPAAGTGNLGLANAQAGIPFTSLPANLQSSIQGQLSGAPVQSISRDDLPNGSVFRVTALRNGVPVEMRFAANGALLGTTPITTGTATSAFIPGGGATILPGSVELDELPNTVQTAIREQLGDAEANRILQQRSANGISYAVTYEQNGQPMRMVVGPDGRVLSNGPATTNSATAVARTGATSATATETMTLDELPDDVKNVLRKTAPYAEVRTISREQRVGGDVYVVSVRDGERVGDLTIDGDGKIIRDTRRDASVASVPAGPKVESDKPQGMPYETLPVAIKNAIRAYATASDIRAITLGLDRDGRTVYDVIFYRDGRRDRMIVRKDGTLSRIEQNVSPALELPGTTKTPVLAIGDLPQEVQDTIRQQTDNLLVKEISTKEVAGQSVYQVKFDENGRPAELLVASDGSVVVPEGAPESESTAARITVGPRASEGAAVRRVEVNIPDREVRTESTGRSAPAERGTVTSIEDVEDAPAVTTETGERPVANVKLKDVPTPVQNTAKKLAGSGTIESISPKLDGAGMVYEVKFQQDGESKTVKVDRDGVVQKEEKQDESATSEP